MVNDDLPDVQCRKFLLFPFIDMAKVAYFFFDIIRS